MMLEADGEYEIAPMVTAAPRRAYRDQILAAVTDAGIPHWTIFDADEGEDWPEAVDTAPRWLAVLDDLPARNWRPRLPTPGDLKPLTDQATYVLLAPLASQGIYAAAVGLALGSPPARVLLIDTVPARLRMWRHWALGLTSVLPENVLTDARVPWWELGYDDPPRVDQGLIQGRYDGAFGRFPTPLERLETLAGDLEVLALRVCELAAVLKVKPVDRPIWEGKP